MSPKHGLPFPSAFLAMAIVATLVPSAVVAQTATPTVTATPGPTPNCGDGVVAPGEGCDDGNLVAADGCSPSCTVEPGFSCTGQPSACGPACANGVGVAYATLTLSKPANPFADPRLFTKLAFKGVSDPLDLDTPPVDPVANGVRVVLDAADGNIFDVTIPGGAYGFQCRGGPNDGVACSVDSECPFGSCGQVGWQHQVGSARWLYVNKNGDGPAGIVHVRVERLVAPERLKFVINAKGGQPYAVGMMGLPLNGAVILDAATDAGQCTRTDYVFPCPGNMATPCCRSATSGRSIKCK
jgi:cysteine-rich repeat protein